jgi:glycosyltransferase involved in cell wall biosynthesis
VKSNLFSEAKDICKKNTRWCSLPIPEVGVYKDSLNSSLIIAFIGSEFLFQCLRYEAELLLLTEDNWEFVLKFGKPDMLLIESCLTTCTGDFRYLLLDTGTQPGQYDKIVDLAKKMNIPIVYWQTLDSRYDDLFDAAALKCDLRYYSDPNSLNSVSEKDNRAKELLPCIQPALHNRFYEKADLIPAYNVLFDGWKEIIWENVDSHIFTRIKEFGLHIVDSKLRQWNKRVSYLGPLASNLEGYITKKQLWKLLRFCRTQVFMPSNEIAQTEHSFRILEAIACGCLPLYVSETRPGGLIENYAVWVRNAGELIDAIKETLDDEILRLRRVQPLWRVIYCKHTYAHRLRQVCGDLEIHHDWEEYPLITGISSTNRPNMLENLISTSNEQTYPNFEHIIVLNNDEVDLESVKTKYVQGDRQKFYYMPSECNVGACLNIAKAIASGKYLTKIDDDDLYGNNHILDMALHLRGADLDFFGKQAGGTVYFEELDSTAFREEQFKHFQVLVNKDQGEKFWIAGCTMSFSKKIADCCDFSEDATGVVDTEYQHFVRSCAKRIGMLDMFNLIVYRRRDLSTHNYRQSLTKKISKNSPKASGIAYDIYFSEEDCEYTLPELNDDLFKYNKRTPAPAKVTLNREKISIGIASIPEREQTLNTVIGNLIEQADEIIVYLNNYAKPPKFLDHPKISVFRSQDHGDLGASGKFFAIEKITNGYYFSVDDDFIYPDNYVQHMVETLQKYNNQCMATVHGSIFGSPLDWYFERTSVFPSMSALNTERFVTLLGSSATAFYRPIINLRFSDFFPKIMCDLTLSLKARDHGLPLISVSRPKNWILPLEANGPDYFSSMIKDDKGRTEAAQQYDWSFEACYKYINELIENNYPGITPKRMYDKKMDYRFKMALLQGSFPPDWDPRTNKLFFRRKLQYFQRLHTIMQSLLIGKKPTEADLRIKLSMFKNEPIDRLRKLILLEKISIGEQYYSFLEQNPHPLDNKIFSKAKKLVAELDENKRALENLRT